MHPSPVILIVDDEPVNRLILESSLQKNGYQTVSAASGEECLVAAETQSPDLILLDILMPGLSGFDTCQRLKSQPRTKNIPVIFLSTLNDADQKTKGFESGGVDYLGKPFDTGELLARVRLHLTLRSQEAQLRQYADNLEEMVDQRTSELKRAEEKLQGNYEMQTALNHLLQLSLQELPLNSLLQHCLENILQIPWLVLQNRGCIYLRNQDEASFAMVAQHNLPANVLEHCSVITPGECACGRAIREESIITVLDQDLRHNRLVADIDESHNHICVPIKSKTTSLALLNLYVEKGRTPSAREEQFLQAVANTLMQMILYKQAEERMLHHVYHDPLTSLPNRTSLLDKLEKETRSMQDDPDYKFALILLNIDRFNSFNESFGFELGDRLITSTAARLLENRNPGEEVLHLGGDEFALLLKDLDDLVSPLLLTEEILEIIRQPYHMEGHQLQATASAGVVLSHFRYNKGEDMLRDADTAVHLAKRKGRGRFEIFNQKMHLNARQAMQNFIDLRQALDQKEFVLFYQPIVDVLTSQAIGVEALIRWQHPARGMVSPGEFIPIVEETGLILPLGKWILEQSCTDMKAFMREQNLAEPIILSVNLSGKQFAQSDLFEQIEASLIQTKFPPDLLKLEITESVVMENAEAAVRILEKLKQLDVKTSIDDFGTGYSSLSYLHRFPVDILKVDRSFVSRISLGGENMEIVRTIVTLGHALNMQIIAEGVETIEELGAIRNLGCEYAQGYYFAKPMSLEDLRKCDLFVRQSEQDGTAFDRRHNLDDRRQIPERRESTS
jgi:diguanylate cyclase (GGDEF)-like protein